MPEPSLDILIPSYASEDLHCHLLRQCVASIERRIPPSHYRRVIIVDDHSPHAGLKAFLDHLEGRERFRIIRNGPPRASYYAPGGSLNRGLEAVEAEYVMILDPHSLIFKGEIIADALACFADPKVMAAGRLTGDFEGMRVVDAEMKRRLDRDSRNSCKGVINACLTVIRTEAWTRHGLAKFDNGGWAHGAFCKSVYDRDFKMCNFDFYRGFYAAHFGGGILEGIRRDPGDAKYNFGFVPRSGNYERKRDREHYAGHPDLVIDAGAFIAALAEAYGSRGFDAQPALPVVAPLHGRRWALYLGAGSRPK